jgi:hypothetical protein
MATPPFTTVQDVRDTGSFGVVTEGLTEAKLTALIAQASGHIERMCDRRFGLFTNVQETSRARGIDPDQSALTGAFPMSLAGALGYSQAAAYGSTNLVRDFKFREYAPHLVEDWTYTVTSVKITRFASDTSYVEPSTLEGPYPDTGACRLPLGTFCPLGSKITVVYSGGYTTIPADIVLATKLQVAKLAILDAEPQMRQGMNLDEIDSAILAAIAEWGR